MAVQVLSLFFVLVVTVAGITDDQYYSMPRLFELDDHDECLAAGGAFCLGSFRLSSKRYSRLMDMIQHVSEDKYRFNHTVINRGYCVTTSCAHITGEHLPEVFQDCVQNVTKTRFKLDAELLALDYCRTSTSPPSMPLDEYDYTFACVVGMLVMANLIGTAYHFLRNPDNKPNRYLMAWSIIESWRRLTADHEKKDPRYEALVPLHGFKAIILILVILTHSVIAHHMTYILNPKYFEDNNVHPLSIILHNGTAVVQMFIILSSFLLAYNVMFLLEDKPDTKVDLKLWVKIVLNRVVRLAPLTLWVVLASATWWRAASSGALWAPIVETEAARCRSSWWTHALFLNNLLYPDKRCLVQTWFIAVDMQLYALSSLLLVFLVRRSHPVRILASMFVGMIVINFCLAYYFDLKSIVFISHPEYIRSQYIGVPSFNWQYAAPWSSAPAALLGLALAFLQRSVPTGFQPQHSAWCRWAYRLAVPGAFAWIMTGYWVRDAPPGALPALYTALERPVFALIASVFLAGLYYRIDRVYWHVLSWRSWQVLSRMSLSVLLVHWWYNLALLAVRNSLARVSVFEIGGHLFTTMFMTYVTSLPLYLMVEVPTQKMLQTLLSK